MALDRQSIEKKDFPIARRGYEPEHVDAHLARIAAEVEDLQAIGSSEDKPRAASMAIAASDQVRTIIEAAETSAAEIEQSAREDAAGIRADANRDAEETRQNALDRSAEHVAKVQEATDRMLGRIDAMQQDLDQLIAGLNGGANRLRGELAELHAGVDRLYDGVGSAAPSAPAPEPVAAPVPPPAQEPDNVPDAADEDIYDDEVGEDVPGPASAAETLSAPAPAGDAGDVEGARLVALNMALNGSSREETDAYLRENFDLGDRAALLDEVYSTVEG